MYKMRLGWYAGASTALAGSVVLFAFQQRPNFYSTMVYLAQSNFCLLILINFTLLLYSTFLYGMTRLCFGRLRAVEVEQLTERAWFAITETCLAMTIFRDEIGAWFLVMFTALVSGKVWGWIGDGRVEILEQQPPANPRLFHLRLSVSLGISLLYDIFLLRYTISTVIQQARPNMMVMFLFEFAVLSTCSGRTLARYLLSITEQNIIKTQTQRRLQERRREVREQRESMIRQREAAAAAGEEAPADQEPLPSEDDVDEMDIEVPGWSAKGEWVLWLDLLTDMVKLGIYIAFFMMLLMFYGLPIHIIRDLFMTSRDFLKRLSALLRYRRAIQEMNRYPDATQEELAQENTCIICREEMHHWDPDNNPGAVDRVRPKKLPCGHTLHLGCLKSWLERQQVCPTCRSPVSMDRARPGDRRVGLRIQIGGGAQPPQQQQPPPQGPAPGPHAPDQALQNQPNAAPPREQDQQQQQDQPPNRPRVFNLGPLRLGFGANGAQLRELAQQFGMPQPQAANDGANAANPPPAPTLNTPIPLSGNNLQDAGNLLQQAELALQRDLQSLEQRQQTIQASQQLLAELQYLRQRQQLVGRSLSGLLTQTASSPNMPAPVSAAAQTPVGFLPPPGAPFQQYPGITGYPGLPARINSPLLGRHGTSGYTTEIPSGSPDLPEGVVLPPGWSLMPLQRLPGAQVPRQLSPQPFPPSSNMEPQDAESFSQSVADIPNTRPGRPHHYATQPSGARPSDFARSNQATEPTPLVSPSPVVPPNWNGQSQLLGNNTQADTVDHLPAANTRQERTVGDEIRERWSQVQVPRVREPESETERPDDPSPAEDTASSSPSSSSSSPEQSDSVKDKGKGKAVTIEEASDAEDA